MRSQRLMLALLLVAAAAELVILWSVLFNPPGPLSARGAGLIGAMFVGPPLWVVMRHFLGSTARSPGWVSFGALLGILLAFAAAAADGSVLLLMCAAAILQGILIIGGAWEYPRAAL